MTPVPPDNGDGGGLEFTGVVPPGTVIGGVTGTGEFAGFVGDNGTAGGVVEGTVTGVAPGFVGETVVTGLVEGTVIIVGAGFVSWSFLQILWSVSRNWIWDFFWRNLAPEKVENALVPEKNVKVAIIRV